jgi:ABC-type nitrate/sulfonate/bicarbonate transport system permease component
MTRVKLTASSDRNAPGIAGALRRERLRIKKTSDQVDGRRALVWRTTLVVLFILVWELLATVGFVNAQFVSKPSSIVVSTGKLLADPIVMQAIGVTLLAVLAGFVIGTVGGVLVGLVLGLQRLLREAFFPVVTLLMGTPKAVFLPLLILFFGLGGNAGIAFASMLAFVHVTVNVVAGVDMVEAKYYSVARAYGATKWRLFIDVIMQGAAPGIFAGLYHGVRNSFIGIVIAQLFVSSAGVGYLVRLYSNNFQTDDAMALVLVMALLVILTGTGWAALETRMTRWRT